MQVSPTSHGCLQVSTVCPPSPGFSHPTGATTLVGRQRIRTHVHPHDTDTHAHPHTITRAAQLQCYHGFDATVDESTSGTAVFLANAMLRLLQTSVDRPLLQARAMLESTAYQTRDVLSAMVKDSV